MAGDPKEQQLHTEAISHFRAGRLPATEALCRQILLKNPNDAAAIQMLGIMAHQSGNVAGAIELLTRATVLQPEFAAYHLNLGSMLASAGRGQEALAAFSRAIQLRPDLPEAHYNFAKALYENGQGDRVIEVLNRAIAIRSEYAEAHNLLGLVHQSSRHLDDAASAYRRAIGIKPGFSEAINNLVSVLLAQSRAEDAVELLNQVLVSRPDFPEALTNLGGALHALGRFGEAVASYQRAIAARPEAPEAHINLGMALLELGRVDEAIASGQRAVGLAPGRADAWYHLGNAMRRAGQLDEAVAAYRKSIAIRPDFADAIANLGNALRDCGRLDESIECCRKAALLTTESWPAEALIYSLYFHPGYDAGQILAEHRKWNDRYARPLMARSVPHVNDRDPDRRLMVGYVSPDFRNHCQSNFTIPLLSNHDHQKFEIFCYSSVNSPDSLTARMKGYADVWRDIATAGDQQAAELIVRDGIDILVDLTMHMDKTRLLAFAPKPAPVQVTWLAYPGTTGLETIDYRLSDPHLDPPGEHDEFYTEKTIRLADSFWCYDPLIDDVRINELPALTNGFISFGCLNNFCKITAVTLDLWAKVLNAIPTSRLIVLTPRGSARSELIAGLKSRGIEPTRIEPIDRLPRETYFAAYNRFDLCLDTFPYNGHTTTLDSLWMGVPPITMAGETAVSRGGLSLLSNMELAEFVARSPDQLVDIARRVASDFSLLAEVRGALRRRMQSSPLMDAPRFARNIESVYRRMWLAWCRVDRASAAL
jgi:protein O-GlcNAc transferase